MNSELLRLIIKNCLFDIEYLFVSDKKYNIKKYEDKFGRKPDLSNPKTFAEKLIYLKMHYNNLLQNVCADKFTVSEYVRQCGYPDILKEIYCVCEDPDDIDFDSLPEKFFMQCSHTQGYNYVVEKKDTESLNRIIKLYKWLLKRKHYKVLRENCYKGITPRVICSEYLEEPGRDSLTDYKFYCFGGEAKYFMVSYGEYSHEVRNHKFDMEWNSIDKQFKKVEAVSADEIPHPQNFDRMVEIVEKLAAPFPHVRVDLYNISGRIVFGEMTFYSAGGFVKVHSQEMDETIGSWINLDDYRDYLN